MELERKVLVSIILFLLTSNLFAQPLPVQTDSMRLAKYKTVIGLDMSVPDFDTKTIDANVMGTRQAGILDYLMENYLQPAYSKEDLPNSSSGVGSLFWPMFTLECP